MWEHLKSNIPDVGNKDNRMFPIANETDLSYIVRGKQIILATNNSRPLPPPPPN